MSANRILAGIFYGLLLLALLSLTATGGMFISWQKDRSRLGEIAHSVESRSGDLRETLTNLTQWVYSNQGFEKNRRYFLWKRLEATPMQVVEGGGDCEDKSKLLTALLRELSIPATMAMLYHCDAQCEPVHTVVLARTPDGWTPLDSVYNITFPDRDGRFLPVQRLMAQPEILNTRLDQLAAERGPADKINRYKRNLETYTHLTTFNWDKNGLTRAVASAIRAMGGDPRVTPRPMLIEDSKEFFTIAGLGLTVLLLGAAVLVGWVRRILNRAIPNSLPNPVLMVPRDQNVNAIPEGFKLTDQLALRSTNSQHLLIRITHTRLQRRVQEVAGPKKRRTLTLRNVRKPIKPLRLMMSRRTNMHIPQRIRLQLTQMRIIPANHRDLNKPRIILNHRHHRPQQPRQNLRLPRPLPELLTLRRISVLTLQPFKQRILRLTPLLSRKPKSSSPPRKIAHTPSITT